MGSRFSVSAIYKAIDQMTPAFMKMDKSSKMFTKSLAKDFSNAQRQVNRFSQNIGPNMRRAAMIGGAALVGGLGFGLREIVNQASKIEDATAGFTPLMGSVEKATELVNRLNQEAATTPFQFEGIAGIAKQLLPVMSGSIEDTANTFRMLGDTAGGNMQKLESITRGYTKALLKGKPDMEALNMIAEAGVPIFSEMAKSMGIAQEDLFELSKQGKLTNDDLTKAFKQMTLEGGIFFKGMEIASATMTGKISTLKDNIALTAAAIGKNLLPYIKPLIDRGIEIAQIVKQWVENNDELIGQYINKFVKAIKTTITFIVNFIKVVAKLYSIIKPFLPLIIGIIVAWKAYRAALLIAAAAQMVMNLVMNANPIGLIITGIGILIGLIYLLVKNWDIVTAALKRAWQWFTNVYDALKGFILIIGGPAIYPLLAFIEVVRSLINNFQEIKRAFTDEGFLGGIMAIGQALLTGLLEPMRSVLGVGEKVANLFKGGINAIFGTKLEKTDQFQSPMTTREAVTRSISESKNMTEVRVTNDGKTNVQTDSGVVKPGSSLILQPSG